MSETNESACVNEKLASECVAAACSALAEKGG